MSNEAPPWFRRFARETEPMMRKAAAGISAKWAASTAKEEDVTDLFQALNIWMIPNPQDPSWESITGGPADPESVW